MRRLTQKLVLVTGAGSGIGRQTALAMAARRARLIIVDIDAARLAEVAAELGEACVGRHVVDVSDRAEMAALATEVHQRFGALDVLINNAGVLANGGILTTPLEDYDWVLSINVMGVVHGCHFFIPAMVEAGGGHVVNVASAFGFWGAPQQLAYVTSKFAVVGFSESLRIELADSAIGVSTICPGVIDTRIIDNMRLGDVENPSAHQAHLAALSRKLQHPPERVARAIDKAIRKNLGLVPVTREAWLMYYVKRWLPWLVGPASRLAARFTKHGGNPAQPGLRSAT